MSQHELLRYNELYVLCWRLIKHGAAGAEKTDNPEKYWHDFRAEGQAIYEKFMDLDKDNVYNIVNSTVIITQNAFWHQDQEAAS